MKYFPDSKYKFLRRLPESDGYPDFYVFLSCGGVSGQTPRDEFRKGMAALNEAPITESCVEELPVVVRLPTACFPMSWIEHILIHKSDTELLDFAENYLQTQGYPETTNCDGSV